MNDSSSYYREQQWVESKDNSDILEYPGGWYYHKKSQMYSYYDEDEKKWYLYDMNKDQWYDYSAAVFYCQNPAVNGTCTTTDQVTVEEDETVYVPHEVLVEIAFALNTKVKPLIEQLRAFESASDQSGARSIMDSIYNEINVLSGKAFEKEIYPVAQFLSDVAIKLHNLKEYATPAMSFREIAEKTVNIMNRVVPGVGEAIPVFYQTRPIPLMLALQSATLGAGIIMVMYAGYDWLDTNIWPLIECWDRTPGNFAAIEKCLQGPPHHKDIETTRKLVVSLKTGLGVAESKGWYKPEKKKKRDVLDYRNRDTGLLNYYPGYYPNYPFY
ncbi:hypothetical protein [Bacillus sp. Marseille-P3661]|uniref:hypothetical protein n=1 Tax=Bacillus sp. Marseille-P3661 TaxID=1936234 RepID=UPI000C86321C|nr:hypothetical protein [Bacillus sp. Marseille-P3661]